MNDQDLKETLQRLEEQQQKIFERLDQQPPPQNHDFWDKLSAISPIMSGIAIATSALLCTYQYNQQQIKLQEAQTIEKFIPHLMGNDTSKRMAILAMKTLVNTDLAAKYAAMFPSEGTLSALKTIAKTGTSEDKKIVSKALGKTIDELQDDQTDDPDSFSKLEEVKGDPSQDNSIDAPDAAAATIDERSADDTKSDTAIGTERPRQREETTAGKSEPEAKPGSNERIRINTSHDDSAVDL